MSELRSSARDIDARRLGASFVIAVISIRLKALSRLTWTLVSEQVKPPFRTYSSVIFEADVDLASKRMKAFH